MARLFPMFVKLAQRKCLVVGAGPVAESKIESLFSCGATTIHVVAPTGTEAITHWAREERLTWHQRHFAASDLDGVFLVIVATACAATNEAVFREAEVRGVLCNAVDDPAHCHFYYPAVVRRGDLQIAISTGGLSPALAQHLRIDLEARFGPEYETWLAHVGKIRKRMFLRTVDPERRGRWLRGIADKARFDKFVTRQKRRQERGQ